MASPKHKTPTKQRSNGKRGIDEDAIIDSFESTSLLDLCVNNLHHEIGRRITRATEPNKYKALASAIRSKLTDKWIETEGKYREVDAKRVYYFSLEFLMGRSMRNALSNLDLEEGAGEAMDALGSKLEDIYETEYHPALGNGGLGRLAACFLDSMATLGIPGYGYGIRYHYGMFKQVIKNGWQMEEPDNWLFHGTAWDVKREHRMVRVKFYGRTRSKWDEQGRYKVDWYDTRDILALPYGVMVPGYRNNTVNLLNLWSAKATDEFNLEYFNHGDYIRAVSSKDQIETISKILYPNDNMYVGRELRLKQQYFFVSASLQDILRYHLESNESLDNLPDKVAIQLNDTHPSVAIPELMRLLIDRHDYAWEKAWEIVTKTFAYTNHTLLPEALEKWDVSLFGNLLPRLLEIIYEINFRFLSKVNIFYEGDNEKLKNMSIIEEEGGKKVRMGNLAVVGSHSVNGVAALHTDLIKKCLFRDFYQMWPEKFNNKTNGVTQRRWLKQANPALSGLITEAIGDKWVTDLDHLKELEKHLGDGEFLKRWREVKKENKKAFAGFLKDHFNFVCDPESMFDVQVKRIHEYKRQLLNVLGVIVRYLRLKNNDAVVHVPRTVIIGGKAAPGYYMAKLIIKLVNDVAAVVNNDPKVSGMLKLFFIPNYRVSLAERIFPASELSEQISTAGKEASGTGNMKFALNGALTIGTLDGANVEIKDRVGEDNIFIFGLKVDEVGDLRHRGYNPWNYYMENHEIKRAVDLLAKGFFSPDDPDRYKPITDALLYGGDQYMHMADLESYVNCQERVGLNYKDQDDWTRKSVVNVANMGFFSSDRTIKEYADEIWKVKPVRMD